MIYFIRHNEHIKIGISVRPWDRLASLQTAHYEPLEMLAIMPGDQAEESRLHLRFAEYRANGEWFRDNPELRQLIEQARQDYADLQEQPQRMRTIHETVTVPQLSSDKLTEVAEFFDTFKQFGGKVEFIDRDNDFYIALPGVTWSGVNLPNDLCIVDYDDGSATPKIKYERQARTLTDRLNEALSFACYFYKAQVIEREGYGLILHLGKVGPSIAPSVQ